ncbi:hypothetical protein AJ79_06127 [Helicocarpus griseus UAMH5409]|uniref:Uncharacterized protein n=1 Tax=Helicocarpus griseus UAMH5409 TaxID=1447875 RepID=A0A2B7XG87_9EURO|nr:hypothetical protein AJ79_06127 [Helicocarpus griseus UAMH5409]
MWPFSDMADSLIILIILLKVSLRESRELLSDQTGGHILSRPRHRHFFQTEVEKADPRIKAANIQGSRAHPSSKDRDDKQDSITVGLETHSGTRIGSLHIHLDGTFKFFPSRAGRQGGYDANIVRAGIKGFMPLQNDDKSAGEQSNSSEQAT